MFQLWFFFFRFGDFRREFYEYAADLMKRVLTNSGMLRVCFLLQLVKRLILAFFFFLLRFSSHTRARALPLCVCLSLPPFYSLSISPFILLLKRTHRGSKKFYVLLTHHSFFFFFFFLLLSLSLSSCLYVCKAVFFLLLSSTLFELRCCLFNGERQFISCLWMNEWKDRERRKKSKWGQIYVCMYVCVHIRFFFSTSFIQREEKKNRSNNLDRTTPNGTVVWSNFLFTYEQKLFDRRKWWTFSRVCRSKSVCVCVFTDSFQLLTIMMIDQFFFEDVHYFSHLNKYTLFSLEYRTTSIVVVMISLEANVFSIWTIVCVDKALLLGQLHSLAMSLSLLYSTP